MPSCRVLGPFLSKTSRRNLRNSDCIRTEDSASSVGRTSNDRSAIFPTGPSFRTSVKVGRNCPTLRKRFHSSTRLSSACRACRADPCSRCTPQARLCAGVEVTCRRPRFRRNEDNIGSCLARNPTARYLTLSFPSFFIVW